MTKTLDVAREYCKLDLLANVRRATEAQAEFAADAAKYGVSSTVKWADKYMKREMLGKASQRALDKYDDLTLEQLAQDLLDEAGRKASYLIPTNSDVAADIYEMQALFEVGKATASYARSVQSE